MNKQVNHAVSEQTLRNSASWSSSGSCSPKSDRTLSKAYSFDNSSSDSDAEEDEIILFSTKDARLLQFATFRDHKDYDTPPDNFNRIREQTIAKGQFQVYKMLGKTAPFIRCGTVVHPVLPKLRVWRTLYNEFVLPQPIPGRYWRLVLTIDETLSSDNLERVFQGICNCKNHVPEEKSDEEKGYSSSASTLDRILDTFDGDNETAVDNVDDEPVKEEKEQVIEDDTATAAEELVVEGEEEQEEESVDDQELVAPATTTNTPYINHPLVPLATRNNILSSTFPLQLKPMEDDWMEILGNPPQYQFPKSSWGVSDLVSSSSNYISDKMERMTLYSSSYIPKLGSSHPQSYFDKRHPVILSESSLRKELHRFPDVPDFYYQAKTVSGYVGWRLWSRVSPWAKRGA